MAVALVALEEEGPLFGDEEFETGEIDHLDIGFNQGEIGVDGEIDADGARRPPTEVAADF